MAKRTRLYRRGVVVVTFKMNYGREWAELYFAGFGLSINRWFGDSRTAEALVPEGNEEYWLAEILKYPGVQGASLDMHL